MPLEVQNKVVELTRRILRAELEPDPKWLKRPGEIESGVKWRQIKRIYSELTALELPSLMPARERRHLDAVLRYDGVSRILEVDEIQHFNRFRAATLEHYAPSDVVAFDTTTWLRRSHLKSKLEGGGFAKAKPPLFPGENGRHKQRAFRDALCDLLPPLYGFAPTLRIGSFEVIEWLWGADAGVRMKALLETRIGASLD